MHNSLCRVHRNLWTKRVAYLPFKITYVRASVSLSACVNITIHNPVAEVEIC